MLSGAILEALGISDARQKATATRHLFASWKDATLALGNQPFHQDAASGGFLS